MPTKSSDNAGLHDPAPEVLVPAPKKEKKPKVKNPALEAAAAKVADQFYIPREIATEFAAAEDANVPVVELVKELSFEELLAEDRRSIDDLNNTILLAVQNRIAFAKSILNAKHKKGLNLRDKVREQEILQGLLNANKLSGRATGVTLQEHEVRYLFEGVIQFGLDHFRLERIHKTKKPNA